MAENYYLGAYWGNREERVENCARRTAGVLDTLAQLDVSFARWYGLGGSFTKALEREVKGDEASLIELFQSGRNRRDADRSAIENLGYRVRFWNGHDDEEAATFSVHCGSCASTAETWIPNSCVIEMPGGGQLRSASLLTLVQSVATNFRPDWAVVNSDAHREMRPQPGPGVPLVGWITYLSAAYGQLPALPLSARAVPIGHFGSAIISTDLRFTTTSSEHVKVADEIRMALERAGLLRRIA